MGRAEFLVGYVVPQVVSFIFGKTVQVVRQSDASSELPHAGHIEVALSNGIIQ
jgi:hypothetical protein